MKTSMFITYMYVYYKTDIFNYRYKKNLRVHLGWTKKIVFYHY